MKVCIPVLAFAVLMVGCQLNTDYFKEYRDVNLLGNYDLNAVAADGTTPKWALTTSSSFMTWEPVTTVTAPDGVSPVYRLEIKNLIPNGDFEDSTITPDGTPTTLPTGWSETYWDGTVPVNAETVQFGADPSPTSHKGSIDGTRALGWDSGGSGNQLRLSLNGVVTPAAWQRTGYLFRFGLRNVGNAGLVEMVLYDDNGHDVPSNTLYSIRDWNQSTLTSTDTTDNSTVYQVVRQFLIEPSPATDVRTVAFGPNSANGSDAAVIDNVRLLPRNESLTVSASFPSLSSGAKPLLPGSKDGMYVFTVAVKEDPTAGALNHFHPTNFSVTFEASVKSGSRVRFFTVQPPSGGWAAWTTLTFKLGFDFVNSDADLAGQPAFKISLSPTVSNNGDYDVGTILVSQPTLTFNP